MIPQNELRIGNYVLTKEGQPVQIMAIFDKSIRNDIYTTNPTDFKYEEDDCDGIPLTRDLFKSIDAADAGGGWFAFSTEGFDYSFIHQGCMQAGNRLHDYPIIYLHQLQNFYYFITGKELEITL